MKLVKLLCVATFLLFASTAYATGEKVFLCHLLDKVDPTLQFNDGIIIHTDKAACKGHCGHGDHPMPVPLDNDNHPNRDCARIHDQFGFPECEVNTPEVGLCSVSECQRRCDET